MPEMIKLQERYKRLRYCFTNPEETPMTRREFLKTKEMKKLRAGITAAAALGYAVAIGSVIVNIIQSQNYNVIIDAVFLVAMSLLIHLLQSRVAAILLSIYAVTNIAVMFYMTGKPGGVIVLAIAVYAVICTFKFNKAWKEHKRSASVQE